MRRRSRRSKKLIPLFAFLGVVVIAAISIGVAWFINNDNLDGSGDNPNAQISMPNAVTFNVSQSGEIISDSDCSFNLSGTNIDVLVRAYITIEYTNANLNSLVGAVVPNISNNWVCSASGSTAEKINSGSWFYLNHKVAAADVNNAITLFSSVSVTNDGDLYAQIEGQTVAINVYVETIQANATGYNNWANGGTLPIPTTIYQ